MFHILGIASVKGFLTTFDCDPTQPGVYAWSGLGIFTIAIMGYIFFKQTLAWQAVLGLFLIVLGVILVNSFTGKVS